MKRSRLEIYFDILKIIESGTEKPTRIMYSANISWNTLQDILKSLLHQDFIIEEEIGSSKRYKATKKGENVLEYYSKAIEALDDSMRPPYSIIQ